MRKGTKVILIVGLSLLVLGGILAGIGFAAGGGYATFQWNGKKMELIDKGTEGGSSSKEEIEDYDLGEIQNITIDVSMADVTFEPSDRLGLRITYYGKANQIVHQVSSDTLTVQDASKNKFRLGTVSLFGNHSSSVTVYLPPEVSFNQVSVHNDCGSTSIGDFSAQTVQADCDLGELSLSNISAQSLTVDNDTGDCKLTGLSVRNLTADVDLGDLNLERISAEKVESVNVDSGDINIIDCNLGIVSEMSCDLGNITASGLTVDSLSANCDTGDIELSGNLIGNISLECDLGNITLNLEGKEEDYGYELGADLGTVQINGETVRPVVKKGGSHYLEIEVSTGDIQLNFK